MDNSKTDNELLFERFVEASEKQQRNLSAISSKMGCLILLIFIMAIPTLAAIFFIIFVILPVLSKFT